MSEYVAAVKELAPTELQSSLEVITFALAQLHRHEYSIERAMESAKEQMAQIGVFKPPWTQAEVDQFEQSISQNGSDLHEAHKDVSASPGHGVSEMCGWGG